MLKRRDWRKLYAGFLFQVYNFWNEAVGDGDLSRNQVLSVQAQKALELVHVAMRSQTLRLKHSRRIII